MSDLYAINSGDLRFRIEIQENTPTRIAKGEEKPSWATIDTRYASITPASGQYFVASEQIRNSVSHKIVMRYYEGLSPQHRLKFGERIFNILSVLNESELNVRHTVLATEVLQ